MTAPLSLKDSLQRLPSLRFRLLQHVMPPLVVTWALGSVLVVGIAMYFAQRAYDRSLLDDALLLASHLEVHEGALTLDLSNSDLRTVLFDSSESVYFAVLDGDGNLIAGHPGLRPPAVAGRQDPQFVDWHHLGRPVRALVLERRQPAPVRLIVAQTTAQRNELLRQLALFSLLPQFGLLCVAAFWLRGVVERDLRPLAQLQQAVEQRDAGDLAPLSESLIAQTGSRDVRGLALSIDELLARVAQGVAAQREFAGNVAHELKTPLAGVRAAAEYGLAQTDPIRWREQLETILRGQARAAHLVDQLLALALANEADGGVPLIELALNECVRDYLVQNLTRFDKAGFELVASGLEDTVLVRADRGLLEGLLGNLLDNALRYGRGEGARGRISVDLARVGDEVVLDITDAGPGIATWERDSLTNRWRQGTSADRLGEGAGLGLSIVGRYAQVLHARFELLAGPGGRGLRARVSLPTAREVSGVGSPA